MMIAKECSLAKIVVDVLEGKTMVFPTETSYGLGCDASNQAAVSRIFAIKGRPSDKPLLVVVPSIAMAKKYLVWNDTLDSLAEKYWPGPLTVVGEYKNGSDTLAKGVVAADGTVAIRVTTHPLLISITEKINRPLVATSANVTDQGNCYSGDDVVKQFSERTEQPDIFLNYDVLPKRPPTTIVRVTTQGCTVLRQGELVVV